MTDWLGRRKYPRYPIVIPFLYGLKGAGPVLAGAGWTRDLSEKGACLELPERLDASALIRLLIRTDQGSIAAEAEVVWTAESRLMEGIFHGVIFAQGSSAQRDALQDLLSRKMMVWQAVVRIPVELPVIFQLKGQPRSMNQGHTENVSRRGLSLRLPLVHPIGTLLEVTLQTPHGPIKVEGTIARVEPLDAQIQGKPIRHGFHFTDISHAAQMALGRVLAEAH